jgi:hypothetical protein
MKTLMGPRLDSGERRKENIFRRRSVPRIRTNSKEKANENLRIGWVLRGNGRSESSSNGRNAVQDEFSAVAKQTDILKC